MSKSWIRLSTAAVIVLAATIAPALAENSIESRTHKLYNSNGRPIGTEVMHAGIRHSRTPAMRHSRKRHHSRFSYMQQTIHQAARRPELQYH